VLEAFHGRFTDRARSRLGPSPPCGVLISGNIAGPRPGESLPGSGPRPYTRRQEERVDGPDGSPGPTPRSRDPRP